MMFDYKTAFSRNRGWVTGDEQQILRNKRIAIAGVGGVGGEYMITMTRLGVGKFNIADLDEFEVGNFNRQAGAFLNTVGQHKALALEEQALSINPELDINVFTEGVNEECLEEFFDGVDLYLDGLDVYATKARSMVFAYCAKHNIPAITAAPIGMGTALMCFMPGRMTFEEFFGMEGRTDLEQSMNLIAGVTTGLYHMKYVAEPEAVDFVAQRSPSTAMGIKLCAGVIGANALKILLGRGKVPVAPHGIHFDAYTNSFKKTWMPGGYKNPIRKLVLQIAKRKLMPNGPTPANTDREFVPDNQIDSEDSSVEGVRPKTKMFKINEDLVSGLLFKVAETEDEFSQAFELVHEVHLDSGFVDDNPHGMRIHPANAHPQSTVFVAKKGDKVVLTISLLLDSPLGLPMSDDFGEEVSLLRIDQRRFAEVSALASDPENRVGGMAAVIAMIKTMYLYGKNHLDLDDFLITASPEHAPLYRDLFLFENFGTAKTYSSIEGVPAVPMRLNLHTSKARSLAAYAGQPPEYNMHDYFYEHESGVISLPAENGLISPWTPELLTYFFEEKTNIFQILSDHQRHFVTDQHQSLWDTNTASL